MTGFYDLARVVAIIPAGGNATRLEPLTRRRAKGALPILANHRLIDIPLSNLINSGIKKIFVTVQSMSHSIKNHIQSFARAGISPMTGEFIEVMSPVIEEGFYRSDAHSLAILDSMIWKDIDLESDYDYAVIMMSDQILKIDLRQILYNLTPDIDMAMVYSEVTKEEASDKLGVLTFNDQNNGDENNLSLFREISALREKLENPPESRPGYCSANLQLLVMKVSTLKYLLKRIRKYKKDTVLSRGVLLEMIDNPNLKIVGYDLNSCLIGGERHPGFFDIESPQTLYEFSMRMCDTIPPFNAHHDKWPLYTTPRPAMAGKYGNTVNVQNIMPGYNLIIEDGCDLRQSILGRNSRIGNGTIIRNSVINDECKIGPNCIIENAILDKGLHVPPYTRISPDEHLARLISYSDFVTRVKRNRKAKAVPVITEKGVIVIPKGYKFN